MVAAVTEPHSLTLPIEAAFGRYLQAFHAQLIADTPTLAEFAARPFAKASAWVPGRMVDQVEDMLQAWRGDNTSGEARATPFLPMLLVAAARDYIPMSADTGRQAAEPLYCMIPDDPKGRIFTIRAAQCELRTQVAVCAADKPTAKSIALQLQMWCSRMSNRRFPAVYRLAGMDQQWPVQLETPEVMGVVVPSEARNLTVLTVDFNLRASIPLLGRPVEGSAESDGKGTDPINDPSGYAVDLAHVVLVSKPGAPAVTGHTTAVI